MEKIDELKTQPIIGKYYLVPCIIKKFPSVNENWYMDDKGNMKLRQSEQLIIFPIINHKHSDKENGQEYEHYHVDYRFVETDNSRNPLKLHTKHTFAPNPRLNLIPNNMIYGNEDDKIEYHKLKCIRLENYWVGGPVNRNKLKHKCMHKGKCPHRGYDLSQVPVVDGEIKCPLHGLRFNAETKQLI